MMEERFVSIKSTGRGTTAPVAQITSQGVTHASLLKRVKEVRKAVEEWQTLTSKQRYSQASANTVPQLDPDTDRLATAFVNHLSEAQETLLEAAQKIQIAVEAKHTPPHSFLRN
jgi:hypothetical protein